MDNFLQFNKHDHLDNSPLSCNGQNLRKNYESHRDLKSLEKFSGKLILIDPKPKVFNDSDKFKAEIK